ncbi:MAG: iron chelate uptake ABC transporter family permease subunit, partial [Gemmatimonas sp.]
MTRTEVSPHTAAGRGAWPWVLGVVLLVIVSLLAIALGAVSLPFDTVINALRGSGDAASVSIVRELRLPRVLLAALVGAGLAMSGGALQGTMRNPLAEP